MRAGIKTLTLLGHPRSFLILRSLADGPKGLMELRRDAGSPAQSTLRGTLGDLEGAGAIRRDRRDAFPGALEYELTEAGQELLAVAGGLERWLAAAPRGPLELGGDPAKAAIKGLVDGWAASVLTRLAEQPLSLTELDKRIPDVSYPTIERCLDTMRLTEQLEVGTRGNRGTPYSVAEWSRRGVGPIVAAAYWEHRHDGGEAPPVCQEDVEGAFSLVSPLIELPPHLSGTAQLVAKASEGPKQRRFMAFFDVHNGGAAYGSVYPGDEPEAWASGSLKAWFATLVDGAPDGLRLSGEEELARAVVDGLGRALFPHPDGELQPSPPTGRTQIPK